MVDGTDVAVGDIVGGFAEFGASARKSGGGGGISTGKEHRGEMNAQVWQELSASERSSIKSQYNAAGISLIVSAFGPFLFLLPWLETLNSYDRIHGNPDLKRI